jgi:hypothetical protein
LDIFCESHCYKKGDRDKMTTRQQRTRNPRTRNAAQRTTASGNATPQRSRNELDFHGNDVEWHRNDIVESCLGTQFGSRGRITWITRCSMDVCWAGNIVSNKSKSSCMIVTDQLVATRRQSVADGYDPDTEIFAFEAFPILARLMVRGAIMSGVDAEEFEELLETLRIQFENADLQGLVNTDVERGVTE